MISSTLVSCDAGIDQYHHLVFLPAAVDGVHPELKGLGVHDLVDVAPGERRLKGGQATF